jgi:hypothetical protein
MIKLLGYMPDVDRTTPGALLECVSYVPSTRGMKAAPSPITNDITSQALAANCLGAALLFKNDESRYFFAGTGTDIYRADATWTDVTRTPAGGGDYSTSSRWRFAQFGDIHLAANSEERLQFYDTATSAFQNTSYAVEPMLVETVGDSVVLANTNDGTYGVSPNRWWVSPDPQDFSPSIANLIATGIITSAQGGIVGLKRFGDVAIFYKKRSMYVGRFVGPPVIFSVTQISGEIGAQNNESIVNIGTEGDPKHIFMGPDDFYSFDGARPQKMNSPIRKTVFSEFNRELASLCCSSLDRFNSLVYFYYPSSSGAIDKCVVYDYVGNRWGRDDREVQYAMDAPALDFDIASSSTLTGNIVPGIINTSKVLQLLVGSGSSGSFTLADVGDEVMRHTLTRVTPRWQTRASTATCTNYYRGEISDSWTQDAVTSMSSSRFDVIQEARWHRVKISTTGSSEISDIRLTLTENGEE